MLHFFIDLPKIDFYCLSVEYVKFEFYLYYRTEQKRNHWKNNIKLITNANNGYFIYETCEQVVMH